MSTGGNKAVVGAIAKRPAKEVVVEMAAIAAQDRARMVEQSSPAPTPVVMLERYSQRPPIRHRARRPVNPVPPPSPEEARVAAARGRQLAEEEAFLLEAAERWGSRPRRPAPLNRNDDPYDLAKWASRRGL